MREEAERRGDVAFVINVGDSFYPQGVGFHDTQWQTRWANVYSQIPRPTKGPAAGRVVPWYSVYGNHDVSEKDLDCSCRDDTQKCNQVRRHGYQPSANLSWYMPDVSYTVKPIPGSPLEVVALDLNACDVVKLCPWVACNAQKCDSPTFQIFPNGCSYNECAAAMARREVLAARLLRERTTAAGADGRSHLIVFSHYPVDYLRNRVPGGVNLLSTLRTQGLRIAYFAGHRHGTENNTSPETAPFEAYTLGGGGGWSCDSSQGYLVGDVMSDGSWDNLRLVEMPYGECCGPPSPRAVYEEGCATAGGCAAYDCQINGNCDG